MSSALETWATNLRRSADFDVELAETRRDAEHAFVARVLAVLDAHPTLPHTHRPWDSLVGTTLRWCADDHAALELYVGRDATVEWRVGSYRFGWEPGVTLAGDAAMAAYVAAHTGWRSA